MEEIEDLAAVAEHRKEPTISHDEVLAELGSDGLLSIRWKQSAKKERRVT